MSTHKLCLVLGDWSHDGHGLTERFHITCNLTAKELEKAHKKGCKKVRKGFDFDREVAQDYEDPTIDTDILERLRELGFADELESDKWEQLKEGQDDEDTNEPLDSEGSMRTIDVNDYLGMWMFLAGLGVKEPIVWDIIEDGTELHIGGYGLFSS